MALVENAIVPKSVNAVVAVDEPQECFPVEMMDVPTSLAHQFVNKLKSRNAAKTEIEAAEKMFKQTRFEDYEESSLARMMAFQKSNSDEVIEKFCKAHKFNEDTAEGLKFAAALLDSDRSAETWIKFQKGEEGEFFVNFVAMRRIGDKVHMGLARHHVKFRMSPYAYESEGQGRGFYSWWKTFPSEQQATPRPEPPREQQPLSLQEINMLENYFLLKAMKKFTEDFPANQNRLPYEDRQYLTMGAYN